MGPRNLHLQHKHRSRPASEASEEDELHETGVHVSPVGVSPPFSVVQTQSHSGSSSRGDPFVHLTYPGETEVYSYDSASRLESRPQASRTNSARREKHHRRAQTAPRPRTRPPPPPSESSSESEESSDSAEKYLARQEYGSGMPRPQSAYYAQNGYPPSSSSGAYGYPAIPPSGQMVHYAPPGGHQMPPHLQQHGHHPYPPMTSPPPGGYPQHPGYHQDPRARHDPNSPQYRPPPYGQGQMPHYGPQGYFPPYQYPPSYHPGSANPYLPAFMHEWQVASHSRKASPPGDKKNEEKAVVPVPAPAPPVPTAPQPTQEEIIKRMQDILVAANTERDAREAERQAKIQSAEDKVMAIRKAEQERAIEEARIRADAVRMAKEQAEAAARAHAERTAHEQRIREEAMRAAEKAIADKAAAAAEQAVREGRIREEAARAALEKAAADAKAKADQEAREKKIAADAADAAKSAAEKKAADDAAAKEEVAKKEKEEAEKKMKEAEEAAAKAKTEAEVAQAAAAAAKPPDKKPPVRFKDAIGRNYNFPWERCCKWRDMENLIVQAFQHIEDLGEHVINGRYDLIGPDKEIIMPQYWDYIVQPDMHITMMLWPLPEKPKPLDPFDGLPDPLAPPLPPPPGVIDLDALLNPNKAKKKDKGKKPIGSSFSNWMLGGAPSRTRKSVKGYKKSDLAAI